MSVEVQAKTREKPISPEVLTRLKPLIPPAERWTPVDAALYGTSDLYHVEKEKAEQTRWEIIKYAFDYHYENNGFYRRYCQASSINPEDVKGPADLVKIPLLPDTFFKDHPEGGDDFVHWLAQISTGQLPSVKLKKNPSYQDVIDAFYEKGITVTYTSGTSGRFSFYPRSELTWMRQRYGLTCGLLEILGKTYDPHRILMQFTPNPYKTFIFIGRVTTGIHLALFDAENRHYIMDYEITPDTVRISRGQIRGLKEKMVARQMQDTQAKNMNQFIQHLVTYAAEKRRLVLAGTPSLIQTVLTILETKGAHLDLGPNTTILTAGGWKMPGGAPMTVKQFREKLFQAWGVPDENILDFYGMSECSSAFPECAGHYKHIPHSVLYPMVLGEDLKPLGYGQYGRFAFLDPLPDSFPGFFITGDRVKMMESCPVCDRVGPVIESDVSRMQGAEGKGCSAIMADMMVNEITDISKQQR